MSRYTMQDYDNALKMILEQGVAKSNKRTGIKTRAIMGIMSRYRIDEYFPIVTRRKVWPRSIFAELLWFLSGSTNNKDLQKLGANIWTPWVDAEFEKKHGFVEGSFGPVYGFQLRYFGGNYGDGAGGIPEPSKNMCRAMLGEEPEVSFQDQYGFNGFDQLAYIIKRIKEDPSCRRIMFSLWNPQDLHKQKLPPCHYAYQVFIDDEGRMTGLLNQRSCDMMVGVPANVQFYSAFTMMLAQQTGYKAYEFVWCGGDCHIYEDQLEATEKYLNASIIDSPTLNLHKADDITAYKLDDFELIGYNPGPIIKIPVAV